MSSGRRPMAILLVSCLYMAVGALSDQFSGHLSGRHPLDHLALIAWILLHPDTRRYFTPRKPHAVPVRSRVCSGDSAWKIRTGMAAGELILNVSLSV
jgi:hypothetical protein